MPLGPIIPISQTLGQRQFTAEPDDPNYNPQSLGGFTAGVPHFDPASIRQAPVPLSRQATPETAASFAPGGLAGGVPQQPPIPFSAQVGVGTGPGAGAGVVPMGKTQTAVAGTGPTGVAPTPTGPYYGWSGSGGQETGSGTYPGYSAIIANMLRFLQEPFFDMDQLPEGIGISGGVGTGIDTGSVNTSDAPGHDSPFGV